MVIKIHIIKDIKNPSVLLDTVKWYKYYQLMKVNITNQEHIKALKELGEIKKNIKTKRIMTRENLYSSKIRTSEIKRKITPELQKLLSR